MTHPVYLALLLQRKESNEVQLISKKLQFYRGKKQS